MKYKSINIIFFLIVNLTIESKFIYGWDKIADTNNVSNQYIILIDASGSVINTSYKRDAFSYALFDELLPQLYEKGFGISIPPYSPNHDLLSLFNFGIVNEVSEQAYLLLKNYDFGTQFIHTIISQQHISKEKLKNKLLPLTTYQLTILSWAKQLALWTSGKLNGNTDKIISNTYLIVVHDALLNESTVSEEINFAERWGKQSEIKLIGNLVDSISQNYLFTNEKFENKWCWQEKIVRKNIDQPIFIEAYQIIPKAQMNLRTALETFYKNQNISFSLSYDANGVSNGLLKVKFKKNIFDFLSKENVSQLELGLDNNHHIIKKTVKINNEILLPVNLPFEDCEPHLYHSNLTIPFIFKDSLIGNILYNYNIQQIIYSNKPLKCSYKFIILTVIKVLVILSFLFCLTYFIIYRFYKTHLYLEITGLLLTIPIYRQRNSEINIPIPPNNKIEIFSLKLPFSVLQYILYNNARISFKCDGPGKLKCDCSSNKSDFLKLPNKSRNINFIWEELPSTATNILLKFSQKKQLSEIILKF